MEIAIFIIAGLGAFVTATLTVGFKSAQAAIASPSESLKDE